MEPSQRAVSRADAVCVLYDALPPHDDSAHISVSRILLPHLDSCGTPKALKIVSAFAWVYRACARLKDEERLREYLVEWHTRNLGRHHLDTLKNVKDLGWAYYTQGRLGDAEKLHVEVR